MFPSVFTNKQTFKNLFTMTIPFGTASFFHPEDALVPASIELPNTHCRVCLPRRPFCSSSIALNRTSTDGH